MINPELRFVIGATGTLGSAVVSKLRDKYTVISASLNSENQVDLADSKSIEALFQKLGSVDAIACCAGKISFAPFEQMTEKCF